MFDPPIFPEPTFELKGFQYRRSQCQASSNYRRKTAGRVRLPTWLWLGVSFIGTASRDLNKNSDCYEMPGQINAPDVIN